MLNKKNSDLRINQLIRLMTYEIIKNIYNKRIIESKDTTIEINKLDFDDTGSLGVLNDIKNDLGNSQVDFFVADVCDKNASYYKIAEHYREVTVFEKVIKNSTSL